MPARPEIGRRRRVVRKTKVFRQRYADQPRGANRHVRVGREVIIDLQPKGYGKKPVIGGRVKSGDPAQKAVVNPGSDVVGDQVFLDETPEHPIEADQQEAALERPVEPELRDQLPSAHNRSGDQVRPEQDEKRKVKQIR